MEKSKKARIFSVIGAVIALFISFLLCRYVFFEFHGNKQWPVVMLVIGLVVTGIAAIFDGRSIMVCTVAGYLGGFILGILQGVESVDHSGSVMNDWWLKWTIAFFVIASIGVFWELIDKIIEDSSN